jgi:biotin carboxyl carrier protein
VIVDIDLDGTRRRVALRRSGTGWVAAIDGRELEVSVARAGDGWSMLVGEVLSPTVGSHEAVEGEGSVACAFKGKSYAIAFDPAPGGALIVRVNGVAVPLTVIEPGPPKPWAKARGARDGDAGAGPRSIVAPMAGRIVRVLVKPEEAVAARQPLVVVEAMKMENELRAPRAGTVAEVRVAEGTSVEANTVLVVLR